MKYAVGCNFAISPLFLTVFQVRLQLWDTAGQERFRSLIPSYIRDSSVAVVVYDITSKHNLWLQFPVKRKQVVYLVDILYAHTLDFAVFSVRKGSQDLIKAVS